MLDYKNIIDNYSKKINNKKNFLAKSLLENKKLLYYFGCNELSTNLSKIIDPDGFIDDYVQSGNYWHGKPIISLKNISKEAIIVNCVINSRPRTGFLRILNAGFANVLSYSDLCRALPDLVPLPNFAIHTRKDIIKNSKKWNLVHNELADYESKNTFDDVLRYRLTADHTALENYSFRPQDQYFENFMKFDSEIFVDAGGFDGDTTEQFCLRYPNYQKVYFFEPSKKNITLANTRLKKYHSIEFIEKGVSNEEGSLFFNSDSGSSSAVSATGDCKIDVTTIDLFIDEKVTFIKMDLEGWEINALEGAKRHIIMDHPKMAIAVYHNPSDIWRIFEFINNIRSDYHVFLRHYTESWTETVMFFMPKKNS
jgi:FkbM family methyltransferase